MKNPEFRRNLWLSFSTHKLIAMPALLGLTFLAVALAGRDPTRTAETVYYTATMLFIFIVWLWGARNANSTIVDELRDKTWDQQRMSSLDPWTMTWGKLFGSTAFNWYGGAFCLIALMGSGMVAQEHPFWHLDLLSLAAAGILLHAALITLNLHTGQVEMQLIQRGGLGWIAIVVVFVAFQPLIRLALEHPTVIWWNRGIDSRLFLLGSLALFAACATFGALRVISNALQVRTAPWAWPLFAIILAVYMTGFSDYSGDKPVFAFGAIGLLTTMIMTYAVLFSEPASLTLWDRLRVRQRKGDWRGWLEQLPLWPTTLLLAFAFATLSMLAKPVHANFALGNFFYARAPFALAFMLLRDACIVLFFSFAPNARRGATVALLYLIVLDALLPFFFKVAGLSELSYVFRPGSLRHGATASVLVMAAQAAIALGLVAWRLNKRKPA